MDETKIIYRSYGIADRFPDGTIELNKHLNDYPSLKKSLLMHESKHTDNQKMNRTDFMNDLTSLNQLNMTELIKFMVRHPFSIVQILPIYWTKTGGWSYDEISVLYWGLISVVIIIGLSIGFLI